jgi:hypothetical protein
MGHLTRSNVENFVKENATAWGSHEILIRMEWGYRKPLESVVVTLDIHSSSEIGYHHQLSVAESGRREHIQKNSPPLGIPFAAMDKMEGQYSLLVQDIVKDDLVGYLETAYFDQYSDLPGRLFRTIGGYYRATQKAGEEVFNWLFIQRRYQANPSSLSFSEWPWKPTLHRQSSSAVSSSTKNRWQL